MTATRFVVECPGASKVYVTGSFNGWHPEAKRMRRQRKGEDVFVAVMNLDPGVYEFRYVADGEWLSCPDAPGVPNGHGTENSVVEVC